MSQAMPRYTVPKVLDLSNATFLGWHGRFDLYHDVEIDGTPQLYVGQGLHPKLWVASYFQAELYATYPQVLDLGFDTVTTALACAYQLAHEEGLLGCQDKPSNEFLRMCYEALKPFIFKPVEVSADEVDKERRLLELLPLTGKHQRCTDMGEFQVDLTAKSIELVDPSKWYKLDKTVKYLSIYVQLGFKVVPTNELMARA